MIPELEISLILIFQERGEGWVRRQAESSQAAESFANHPGPGKGMSRACLRWASGGVPQGDRSRQWTPPTPGVPRDPPVGVSGSLCLGV